MPRLFRRHLHVRFLFSHQEGHIEAIRFYSELKRVSPIICFHFSGGTTEAVLLDEERGLFDIVGGSKDIAYGQVLDRVGVALGLEFPCGEALDKIAVSSMGHIAEYFDADKSKRRLCQSFRH